MSWNPVLNRFLEIKEAFVRQFGRETLFAYDAEKETCLEYWVRRLEKEEDRKLLAPLKLNEWKDFLLIHYGNYADLSDCGTDLDFDAFWDAYDGLYQECRSVVLNIREDSLVLTPFRKFRNLNECEANSYENIARRIREADCVEFAEKLDGSMQSARFYQGEIRMAGSMALNPEQSWRLSDGYRMMGERPGYRAMLEANPDRTFVFEYISLRDAHVVKYEKEQEGLYLIGVRDMENGREASYREVLQYAQTYDLPAAKVFSKTLEEVVAELDEKRSDEAEGFVVYIDGYRVKIKYNDYVTMHHMLSTLSSDKVIIRAIADGTFDDLLAKVPQAYRERVMETARFVYGYIHDMEQALAEDFARAPKEDRKTFMLWVEANVPAERKALLREMYLGRPYNVLRTGSGHLRKMRELKGGDRREIFEE